MRADSRTTVLAASVSAATLIAHQVVAKAARDALFLSTWGVSFLPRAMIAGALISLVSVLATARLLARLSPARVVPGALLASAALGAIEWSIADAHPYATALLLYLHLAVFGATTISAFWSLINERFDARTVKRVISRIASGGTVGGVIGGVVAFSAAAHVGVRGTIAAVALLHVASAGLVLLVARGVPARPALTSDTDAASGFAVLREMRYLRDVAAIVALVAALNAFLDYSLSAHAAASIERGAPLLSFFALFHMSVGLLTFLAQTIAGRLALERLGAAGAIAVLPTIALLGSLIVLPTPRLLTVAALRSASAIAENSVFRAGYELLFTPISVQRKRPTKTLIDVGFDRVGTAFGGVVTMIIARSSQASWLAVLAIGIAATLIIYFVRRLHGGYVRALADNLRLGAPKLGNEELHTSGLHLEVDRTKLLREVEALRSGHLAVSGEFAAPLSWPHIEEEIHESAATLLADAAALLGSDVDAARVVLERPQPLDARLIPHAIALLGNPALQGPALEGLRRVADAHVGQLVDALLDPNTPFEVRRALPRVLSRCTAQRAVEGLVNGLRDRRFEVRWACGLALLKALETRPSLTVSRAELLDAIRREIDTDERLWEAEPPLDVHDGDDTVLPFAEKVLRDRTSRSLQHVFALLALAYEREPMRLALRALSSDDRELRGTALEYLENVLPDDVRERLWPYVGDHRPPRPPVVRKRPPHAVLEELLRSGAIHPPSGLTRRH